MGSESSLSSFTSVRTNPCKSRLTCRSEHDLHMRMAALAVASAAPPPDMSFEPPWRRRKREFGVVVAGHHFQLFFLLAIIANSAFIGAEVQYLVSNQTDSVPAWFLVVHHSFAALFLLELILRWCAEGRSFLTTKHLWNGLDALIVFFSLFEIVTELIASAEDTRVGVQNINNIRIVRIIRITRIMRIFRLARILRFVRSLRTLVYSIICTLKSLMWAVLLLALIIYVFGIVFTQATHDHLISRSTPLAPEDIELEEYWGSVLSSMFTLFQAISNGISWRVVCDPLGRVSIAWVLVFAFYISFASFAVLNVMTGVFCHSAMEGAEHDREMILQSMMVNKKRFAKRMQSVFKCMDTDNAGFITIKKFESHLSDEPVQVFFAELDVDTSDAWALFKLLDADGDNMINLEEFVVGCAQLTGQAKSVHVAQLMYECKWLSGLMSDFIQHVDKQFVALGDMLPRHGLMLTDRGSSMFRDTLRDDMAVETTRLSSVFQSESVEE